MPADNPAEKEVKGSIQSLVGFYGHFFLLSLLFHSICFCTANAFLSQKMFYCRKRMIK